MRSARRAAMLAPGVPPTVRLLYSALLYLVTPLVLLRLLWRGLRQREYWRRIAERFGHVPRIEGGAAVWVHAVSVGETAAALPLIRALAARHPPRSVLVTTTTPTGSERVRAEFGEQVLHTYAPYDLPHVVRRFASRVKPKRVIVMETEVWPNLFHTLGARGVPLVLANARLSPRSFAGYSRIRGFAAGTLGACSAIAAQSEEDAARFRALGVRAERVHAIGNLKFDVDVSQDLVERGRRLRQALGAQRPVWIAASTHEGEEEVALNAHRILRKRFRDAVLILVPRHPQRFDAVARLTGKSGLALVRRSAGGEAFPGPALAADVLLGDSMGEMTMYFAAADVAFVGGSLAETGGHNVLEPASLGIPVVFGPYMFNFAGARDLLVSQHAALQIDNALALAPAVTALLGDAERRTRMGGAGRAAVQRNRGALDRLLRLIDGVPSPSSGEG